MKGKRLISSLLSMAMIFSLNTGMSFADEAAPVTEEPVVEEQTVEDMPVIEEEPVIEDAPVIEEEPATEDQSVTEEEPVTEESQEDENEYPEQTFTGVTPDGSISVEVIAGEGALPKDASMHVENVNNAQIEDLVNAVVDGEANSMLGVNVIFNDKDGNEIEPLTEIIVNIRMTNFEAADKYHLVHIDQANNPDRIPEDKIITLNNSQTTFATDVFSIYVVVGEDIQDEYARLTVEFYNGDSLIETMYVKTKDPSTDIEKILYDPGAGTPPENQIFMGWSLEKNYTTETKAYTIQEIREYVEALDYKEGDVLKVYAMFLKGYKITYIGDKEAVLGSEFIKVEPDTESVQYTVNQLYTPEEGHNFEGWLAIEGKDNIDPAATDDQVFPNGTEITIKGDVKFAVNAPEGHWIVFHENKGTYVAPQFIKKGEATVEPTISMERPGYSFGGWYTDKDCTDGNEFTFGSTIDDKTDIYAKWVPNPRANYTVIIWLERIDASEGHDYKESVRLSGTPETTITSVTGTSGAASVSINGRAYSYTGFSLDRYDTNVVIDPAGGTVLNVYFKRNTYHLYFQRRIGNTWTTIDTITAKYEENIEDEWPIVDSRSGRVYDQGERWDPQTNPFGWSEVMVYLDIMPSADVTFHLDTDTHTTKTMNLYVEALPGETGQTVNGPYTIYEYSSETENHEWYGKKFVLYKSVKANYLGFTIEDFVDLSGYTRIGSGSSTYTYYGTKFYRSTNNTVNFYYSRNTSTINFMDGSYFRSTSDGDIPLSDVTDRGQLHVSDPILYDNDITSYNKDGADYYAPTYPEYTFAGWYIDKDCTHPYTFNKMAKDSITVYAKWMINQYRVFLHPNAGTDPSLDWGSSSQQMNFLVPSGGQVSSPTGTRADYEFVGWFIDDKYTKPFNGDAFELNDSTVTTPYDKTVDMTDPMDKWGNGATTNADVNRPWVTKKLDLYGRWRAKLEGAEGIGVIYDANGGSLDYSDSNLYKDTALATAGPAATAPDDDHHFEYWVVQKWNGTAYEDTNTVVYPGNGFEVLKANARVQENEGSTPQKPSFTYTVQLKAVYLPNEKLTPTHIYWYGNGGTTTGGETVVKDENKKINEAVPIRPADTFTKDGYQFAGWERREEGAASGELFLKYDKETGKFYAKDDSGNFTVEATQVAADEKQPYHDLYAVWESVIYVWHSSTAEKEEITMDELAKNNYKLNIISKVDNANYYYGGWYTNYNGDDTQPYNAGDRAGEWKFAEAGTTDGSAIAVPQDVEPGTTYYLKEVPKAYLSNYTEMIYKKETKKVINLFQMSAVDDLSYKEAGFIVIDANQKATVVRTFIFKQDSGTTKVRRADLIFNGISNPSYLTYLDMGALGFVAENSTFTVTPYWITPDNVQINGVTRTVNMNNLEYDKVTVS